MNQQLIASIIISRRGILLDTSALLLLLTGLFDPGHIERYKRTAHYGMEVFDGLHALLSRVPRCYITAHILSEVWNLLPTTDARFRMLCQAAVAHLQVVDEIPVGKAEILDVEELSYFGAADVSVALVARKHDLVVITDDLRSVSFLAGMGVDSITLARFLDPEE